MVLRALFFILKIEIVKRVEKEQEERSWLGPIMEASRESRGQLDVEAEVKLFHANIISRSDDKIPFCG